MIGRTAVAGLAAAALMASSSVGSAAPVAHHLSGASGRAHVSVAHVSAAAGLAALRRATARYHDLQRAQNAGYGFFTDVNGIACIAMPGMGGMGVHFVDSSLVADPTEHALRPEALVYRIDQNGKLRLAAVEYVVIASAWDATHPAPPRLFGQSFALTPAGNRFGLPAYYSLHAWPWYHNPVGAFAPFNPRVHC